MPAGIGTIRGSIIGNYFDVGGIFNNGAPNAPPVVSPDFQLPPNNAQCIAGAMGSVAANMTSFALAIAANPQAYTGVASSAQGFLAGTVSLEWFATVALSFLGVPALVGLALSFGLTVYAFYQAGRCG
jgi:hypothetical protein